MKGMEGYIQCSKHGVYFMPSGSMDCPACKIEKVNAEPNDVFLAQMTEMSEQISNLEDEVLFLNEENEELKAKLEEGITVGVDTDGDGEIDAQVNFKKDKEKYSKKKKK
jgi:hypothetical protein